MEQTNDTIQNHLEAIRRVFPDEIAHVTVHDGGDDFLVIEVNSEWMFRFPRQDVARKALTVEKAFLSRFKSISPLPVPNHQYSEEDFVSYPKIHGALLTVELFRSLSNQTRERIARQVGGFLSAVHNFPVEEAKRLGLTEGWGGWRERIVQNFRERIAPSLSPSARRKGLACFEQIEAEAYELRVIHGDFALEDHAFFDEARQALNGVIDFADVTLFDPAYDFQNILEYGGEEFFAEVMSHYRAGSDPAFLRRTKLHIEARPLFEASYSVLFGFEEQFKDRMKYLEEVYGA